MHNEYHNSEEFKEILRQYKESEETGGIFQLEPEDYVDIADYFLVNNSPEDGMRATEKGLSFYPGDEELLLMRSGIFIYNRQYEKAKDIVESANEDFNDALYQQAQLTYALEHDDNKAEQIFLKWLEKEEQETLAENMDPAIAKCRKADAYIHIISSFIELHNREEGYDPELVRRWIEEYLVAFQPLGTKDEDKLLADILRDENMFDMIAKVYPKVLENAPYYQYGYTVLANAQHTLGRFEEAVESADFALAIDAMDLDAMLVKAHSLQDLGFYNDAVKQYEQYLSYNIDDSQYLAYAMCLISSNQLHKAEQALDKSVAYNYTLKHDEKNYADACLEVSVAYSACENISKARTEILKCLEIEPNNPDYVLQDATLDLVDGIYAEAYEKFNKHIALSKDKICAGLNVVVRFLYNGDVDIARDTIEIIDDKNEYYYTTDKALFNEEEQKIELDIITLKYNENHKTIILYKTLIYYLLKEKDLFFQNLQTALLLDAESVENIMHEYLPEGISARDILDNNYILESLMQSRNENTEA